MMRPTHLRMARAALDWTLTDLASRAGVNKNSISRYESGKEVIASTVHAIETVLMKEGVVFFEDDIEFGTGIRLKKAKANLEKERNAKRK